MILSNHLECLRVVYIIWVDHDSSRFIPRIIRHPHIQMQMNGKVMIQGAPVPGSFCEWQSVIRINSGAIQMVSGICVLSRRRREYAFEL